MKKPEKREPAPGVRDLLAAIYPTIRWERVTFYEGLPAWVQRFTRGAITLPDALSTRGIHVYVGEGQWNPCTPRGLGLLVHECFHVLQFQERLKGVGLGPLRVFALQYLARALFEGGDRNNHYEKPAYAQEDAFVGACGKPFASQLCSAASRDGARDILGPFIERNPSLVRRTSRA
jgi:hypothetical protein